MREERPVAGVGLVGYAFMGKAHSLAWRTVSEVFDPPVLPRLTVLSGRRRSGEVGHRSVTHEIYDFLAALGPGIAPAPSFADGLQVQRVLDAVTVSVRTDSRMTSVSGG
jgi:hypothetical protein